jgi:hypothetical protein
LVCENRRANQLPRAHINIAIAPTQKRSTQGTLFARKEIAQSAAKKTAIQRPVIIEKCGTQQ